MGFWTNSDGLYIKYGQDQATPTKGGHYSTLGLEHVAEVYFNCAPLGTTGAIVADNVVIPSGARISRVRIITEVAVTSAGSPTLDIGLVDQDRTSMIDDDGLVAALALASFNAAGETYDMTNGTTGAGVLVGTTLTNSGLIVASYNTAAFTAGVIRLQVHYYFPTV